MSYCVYCHTNIKTGVQQSDISKACNGKLKTAGKLHWRFAEGVQ